MTSTNQDIGTNPRAPFMSGDSRTLRVPVKDQDGAVFDLTSATAIKWELFLSDGADGFTGAALLQKALGSGVTKADAALGIMEVAMVPADTASMVGDFYHEAEVTMVDGSVHTVFIGKFKITSDAIE